ncbi:MAG: P-II family nitrogen regulator [Lachnospiraceae bacterium]
MKKLEIIIKAEKLEELKAILDAGNSNGVMISNIMGYGNQKGHKRLYRGAEYSVNLLPKVRVETVVTEEEAEPLIDAIVKEINTGDYGDGKIFVYDVQDAVRIRTGERGTEAL